MKKKTKKINFIIFLFIISLILYFSGVMSGLYANKIITHKVNLEINEIKKTLDDYAVNLKDLQLQDLFINYYINKDKCKFLNIYTAQVYPQLNYYWNVLPKRIEKYDKKTKLSNEYLSLKKEYTRLMLKLWVLTSENYYDCKNKNFIPILYFYTANCSNCLKQGEEFDKFKKNVKNQTVIVFPIDANFKDDGVYLLKQYYNLSKYPATIINNKVYQEQILTSKDLMFLFKFNKQN